MNGADIKSVYVEMGKEIYQDAVERDNGLEVKVKKVTNAEPFELRRGEKIDLPKHQADWALHMWGFLQVVSESDEPMVEPDISTEPVIPEVAEVVIEPKDESERFAELQIKGYTRLHGKERDEYKILKDKLTKQL